MLALGFAQPAIATPPQSQFLNTSITGRGAHSVTLEVLVTAYPSTAEVEQNPETGDRFCAAVFDAEMHETTACENVVYDAAHKCFFEHAIEGFSEYWCELQIKVPGLQASSAYSAQLFFATTASEPIPFETEVAAPGEEPASNTAPPTIGGEHNVGGALEATPGEWSAGEAPYSYEYTWYECAEDNEAECHAVTTQSGEGKFALEAGAYRHYFFVEVHAHAANDEIASARSALVGPVGHSTTATPVLLAPATATGSSTPLHIEYELPEEAAAKTLELTFADGKGSTTLTLAAAAGGEGTHEFALDTRNLTADATHVLSASAEELPDGVYTVTLSYQNTFGAPAASVQATGVDVRTVTAAPTLLAPSGGTITDGTFDVRYTLPEAALAGTVRLVFEGELNGTQTIVLTNVEAGEHTVAIDPTHVVPATGIASGPAELPKDKYRLSIGYQDALANPAARSAGSAIRITRTPLCDPGTFSESGESPCSDSPAGYYVSGTGITAPTPCAAGTHSATLEATSAAACEEDDPGHYSPAGAGAQIECRAGYYQPEHGAALCLPAEPGHHVAKPGATAEQECEAGTLSSASGNPECSPATPGHYVEHAAAFGQVPCAPGSYSANPGATHCQITPAGTYAPSGATEPTPCPAGTESGPGAAACTPTPSVESTGPSGGGSTGGSGSTGGAGSAAKTAASEAPGGSANGAAPTQRTQAIACTVTRSRRQPSLLRRHTQAYALRCNATATVRVAIRALVTAGRRHATLHAAPSTVRVTANRSEPHTASFTLTRAARALLKNRHARIAITVSQSTPHSPASVATTTLAGAR